MNEKELKQIEGNIKDNFYEEDDLINKIIPRLIKEIRKLHYDNKIYLKDYLNLAGDYEDAKREIVKLKQERSQIFRYESIYDRLEEL